MSDTNDFYTRLPAHSDFLAITKPGNYEVLPDDWSIIITDVVNSTAAIERGQYKDVNTSGALAAIALANALGSLDFPFVFGGDGVTMLLPESQMPMARDILASTRALCKTMFGLTLRVGAIPVKTLTERGFAIQILKYRISDRANQAILIGAGMDEAEALIKNPVISDKYLLPEDFQSSREADFSGYLCAWLDIPSHKGETISLIIKPLEASTEAVEARLFDVLTAIHRICGTVQEHHPLSMQNLSTTAGVAAVERNAMVFHHAKKPLRYWRDFWSIWLKNIAITVLPRSKTDFARRSIMADADFRKFDGALKMVLSCTPESRKNLTSYLESLREQGSIVYGMHVADKALMTCFIQSPTSHIHFIDTANGGYALAAKQLKQQLKELRSDSL